MLKRTHSPGFTAMLCALALLACGGPVPLDLTRECAESGRVAQGHVVMVNAYYLQEEATRALRRGEPSSLVLEEVLSKAKALGVSAIRTNAFNDDPTLVGDSAIQIAPLTYDEVSLRGLDWVLTRAQAHGLQLVLPLGNYWDAYGGVRQYLIWAGLANPEEGDARFFTDPDVRALYVANITSLLNRVNTYDGIRYGSHPAVMAWELLNEPRGKGLDPMGLQMRAWVDAVGAVVKGAAPDAAVSTGEEGFDTRLDGYGAAFWKRTAPGLFRGGSSFTLNLESPFVDLASIHLYPELWGVKDADPGELGLRWIEEHAEIARGRGKRLLVGEFGLRNEGGFTLDMRRDTYRAWLRCARRVDSALAGPWLFANDSRPDAWDLFTFYFKTGTDPADPINRYADLLRDSR